MKPLYTAREIATLACVTKQAVKQRMGMFDNLDGKTYLYSADRIPPEWRERIEHREAAKNVTPMGVTFATAKNIKTRAQAMALHTAFQNVQNLCVLGKPFAEAMRESLAGAIQEMQRSYPGWALSDRRFRDWYDRWIAGGKVPSAVTLQKQGRCGRKPLVSHFSVEQLSRAKAVAVEQAQYKGKPRIAPGYQALLKEDLPPELKERLNPAPASKSYVPPSIRRALQMPLLIVSRHHSQYQAKVDGAYTMRDWDLVAAGDVWQSDDFTIPVYWWIEIPEAPGYRIMQGQWLPLVDLGSQRILTHVLIARETGAYVGDDIYGLCGHAIREYGLPNWGFYFERGIWKSTRVIGERTGIDPSLREGALADLGLSTMHAVTPRAKVIEGIGEHLQRLMQSFPGYRGRDPHHEKFLELEKAVRSCRNGSIHPAQIGLLHFRQIMDKLHEIVFAWNSRRNDGKVCKGRTPDETWVAKLAKPLRRLPDQAAYMLYANMNRVKVTRNGVRVENGKVPYYWDNPELLRIQGKIVRVWWTREFPEVCTITDDEKNFICHGKLIRGVHPIHGDMSEDNKRLAARSRLLEREYRSVMPSLPSARGHVFPYDEKTAEINSRIEDGALQGMAQRAEKHSKARSQDRHAHNLSRLLSDDAPAATDAPSSEHTTRLT